MRRKHKLPTGKVAPRLIFIYDEYYYVWRENSSRGMMELLRRSDGMKLKLGEDDAFFRTRTSKGIVRTNDMRDKINNDSDRVMYIGRK